MVPEEKTTDEFIKSLFDKRDIDDKREACITGYRLSKAFDSVHVKPNEVPESNTEGLTAEESFTLGYREALND